jgi:amidase
MNPLPDYEDYDGLGLAELVREGEVSALELAEAAISRIEAHNQKLNAVIHKLYERARKMASAELPDGPFRGVPFLFKDLTPALAEAPLCKGSRFFQHHRADQNGELADRYMASGVVVVGKTNTPELGILPTTEPEVFGPTRNPWDLERSPGGSSGGSAAAVGAGLVPLAGGGDGGGSIRIPASCCGLFGLKPTRGRTPTGPQSAAGWQGYAVDHVITRSVRDSAAMLDATCGHLPGDLYYLPRPERPFLEEVGTDPGRLRIAFTTAPFLPGQVHADCVAATLDAAKLLEELGHDVIEKAPSIDGQLFSRSFLIVLAGEVWADIEEAGEALGRTPKRADFEGKTWLARVMGGVVSAGELALALRRLQTIARSFHELYQEVDVLLTPTLAMPPQPLGFLEPTGMQAALEWAAVNLPLGRLVKSDANIDKAGADAFAFIPFTPVFNVTGQPSASVPLYWNEAGLPVGVMLSTAFGQEATLFRLAGQLEQARPWAERRPPLNSRVQST